MTVQYMGGKAQVARQIVAAILSDSFAHGGFWYEPFVGGANVTERAAPYFQDCLATDAHPDLILLWQHLAAGGTIPDAITEDEYHAQRNADPSWFRGLVGFGASFGGKWFGGYGKLDYIDAKHPHMQLYTGTAKVVRRQGAVFAKYGVRFECRKFGEVTPPVGAVVYCDPPYANTTRFSTDDFDYDHFYAILQEWAKGRFVYVSEYATPERVRAKPIWSQERSAPLDRKTNNRRAIETLFRILPDDTAKPTLVTRQPAERDQP